MEICDNTVTVITVYYAAYTPIQCVHSIQTWSKILYIVVWLSCHNHLENQGKEIPGMNKNKIPSTHQ